MAKLLERRCSCCGHIYKHEDSPNYISFCPKCMKDGFYETYYIEDGIKPCRIFLGEETIGEMTSVTDTSYIITSDRFDIHERIDDSLNPYLEATDMLFYMLSLQQLLETLEEKKYKWEYYCQRIDILPNAEKTDIAHLYELLIQAALFSNIGISREELLSQLQLSENTLRSRLRMIPDNLLIENRQKVRKYYLLDLDATDKLFDV